MTTDSTSIPSPPRPLAHDEPPSPPPRWRVGLVAGAVAAVANTLLVAVARGVDVPLEVGGEPIPLLAVPQLTIFGALAGIGIAAVAARRARRPQRAFVVTTIGLTAASLVPDALIDTDTATRLVLALAHLVAAAITIPALARRLPT